MRKQYYKAHNRASRKVGNCNKTTIFQEYITYFGMLGIASVVLYAMLYT